MISRIYNAYKGISENFTLIVDTREQETERYYRRMEAFEQLGIHTLRQKLDVGDYSAFVELPNGRIIDFSDKISVERKMDLEELLNCFGSDRDRFETELLRAKVMGCRLYVAPEDGSYIDILTGNFKSAITVASAKATFHTFEQRYNTNFTFVTPDSFPAFVYETLRRYIMDYLCKTYPNGEIL